MIELNSSWTLSAARASKLNQIVRGLPVRKSSCLFHTFHVCGRVMYLQQQLNIGFIGGHCFIIFEPGCYNKTHLSSMKPPNSLPLLPGCLWPFPNEIVHWNSLSICCGEKGILNGELCIDSSHFIYFTLVAIYRFSFDFLLLFHPQERFLSNIFSHFWVGVLSHHSYLVDFAFALFRCAKNYVDRPISRSLIRR